MIGVICKYFVPFDAIATPSVFSQGYFILSSSFVSSDTGTPSALERK